MTLLWPQSPASSPQMEKCATRHIVSIKIILFSPGTLIGQPWKIMSVARRDWDAVGHSL